MRISRFAPIILLAAAESVAGQATDRISIPGETVAVYNIAGAVSIERGTGSNVIVEVTRTGPDAAQLQVERRDVDGRAALVVLYPDDDVVYEDMSRGSRTTMDVHGDGTFFRDRRGGDRITIRGSGSGTEAHADLRILVPAGRSVDVRLGVGTVTASNVEGGLDIDVSSASVSTTNTKGRLRIDTGSGRVSVNGAEGDDILVDTGSGRVEVNDIRGNRLLVDTGSGAVSGRNILANDIEIDTGSGGVDLDIASQVQRLSIDTGSGRVRLALPAGINASLEVETGSGGISTDLPVRITERERDQLIGTLGNGGGRIVIDTGSGGVSIVQR